MDSHEWVPRALRWIDERPEGRQPFLLFMNWMDAHEPGAIVGRPGLSVAPGPRAAACFARTTHPCATRMRRLDNCLTV